MLKKGVLYIVATPLGNLNDISFRALEILKSVELIAAEDTRHSQKLLQHYGLSKKLLSYHQHNEQNSAEKLIPKLNAGYSIALISDAGTPLISDPGYDLVKLAHENGIPVSPIPGPSAVISALSASGLACDKFIFEGFLPAHQKQRLARLEKLSSESRTMVFYEAPHRIQACVKAMRECFGESREAVLARELTKTFETIHKTTLGELDIFLEAHPEQLQGEIVLILAGNPKENSASLQAGDNVNPEKLLALLLPEVSLKEAVKITGAFLQLPKNQVYDLALRLKK